MEIELNVRRNAKRWEAAAVRQALQPAAAGQVLGPDGVRATPVFPESVVVALVPPVPEPGLLRINIPLHASMIVI